MADFVVSRKGVHRMITWILIIFAHVGPLSDGNSVALESVPGFSSTVECTDAGNAAQELAKKTTKIINYVCVRQKRQ